MTFNEHILDDIQILRRPPNSDYSDKRILFHLTQLLTLDVMELTLGPNNVLNHHGSQYIHPLFHTFKLHYRHPFYNTRFHLNQRFSENVSLKRLTSVILKTAIFSPDQWNVVPDQESPDLF